MHLLGLLLVGLSSIRIIGTYTIWQLAVVHAKTIVIYSFYIYVAIINP